MIPTFAFLWFHFGGAWAFGYNFSIADSLQPQFALHLNALHELLLCHMPPDLTDVVFYHSAENDVDTMTHRVTINDAIRRLNGQRTARVEHILAVVDKSHYAKRMTLNVILVENARSFR